MILKIGEGGINLLKSHSMYNLAKTLHYTIFSPLFKLIIDLVTQDSSVIVEMIL